MSDNDHKPVVGVMGSHEESWTEFALPLGLLIAEYGYHLLTGCGGGVMSEVAKGYSQYPDERGVILGIKPVADYKKEVNSRSEFPNPYIDIPIVTHLEQKAKNDSMPYSRNLVNIMTSDVLVVLPGSHGTQNEASLGLLYEKPLVLFGPEEAFDRFPEDTTFTDDIKEVAGFFTQKLGRKE